MDVLLFFLYVLFSLFYRSKPRPASHWKRSFLSDAFHWYMKSSCLPCEMKSLELFGPILS